MKNSYTIVCFGDSVTKSYSHRLSKVLAEKYPAYTLQVINEGVVSETTVGGLTRLNKILGYQPDIVLIGFGMNDWRKGVDKLTFEKNLKQMVTSFKEKAIRTILLTMNPDAHIKNKISEKLVEYNNVIRSVAYDEKVRIADVYSLWMRELPKPELGLYDEIHPNEHVGNKLICEAISRIIFRTQTVVVWGFNGLYPFCNYECPYCYVASDVNDQHHLKKEVPFKEWSQGFKTAFGNEKIVFYLSFGEPTLSLGFYDVLDMIAKNPNWAGHMTSNLSAPLDKLVNTQLVKEHRFFVNGSFHPTQVDHEKFLSQVLFLRDHGIECPVIIVAHPPVLPKLQFYVEFFSKNNFLVHIRRFRGWYNGKYYPSSYTEEERRKVAKYCDDATIKYMLNESTIDLKGKLSYEGMYYILADENGDIWTSPDSKSKYLGNIFKENVRLYTEPQPYTVKWNGSVNGVADLLETGYTELRNNFVMSFSNQGGVHKTESEVFYKNLTTDFSNSKVRQEYGFPNCDYITNLPQSFASKSRLKCNEITKEYITRKIYPVLERKRRSVIKSIYELLH